MRDRKKVSASDAAAVFGYTDRMRLLLLAPLLLAACNLDRTSGCESGSMKCPSADVCCPLDTPYHQGSQCYSRPPAGAAEYCGPDDTCASGSFSCPKTGGCCPSRFPYAVGTQCGQVPGTASAEFCGTKHVGCSSGYTVCASGSTCCPVGYPYYDGSRCYQNMPSGFSEYCG